MTLPATTDPPAKLPKLKGKQRLWLRNYLNQDNPKTFFNSTNSAKYANYQGKDDNSFSTIGSENIRKLTGYIDKWLEEFGLSDRRLKGKLLTLVSAKETKFFQKDGKVTDTREVEALEIQRRSLDMAMKVKGMYADHEQAGAAKVLIYAPEVNKPKNTGLGEL